MNREIINGLNQQFLRLLLKMFSKDSVRIHGRYRCSIRRKNGTIERDDWIENTIQANLKEVINDCLLSSTDFALNNLFTAKNSPPTNGKDGIALISSGPAYSSMITTSEETTSLKTKFTGTYEASGDITFTDARLGQNWATNVFTLVYAIPTSWTNKTLADGETLTVEWEITIG